MLGCCLNSFHFLWAILSTSTVVLVQHKTFRQRVCSARFLYGKNHSNSGVGRMKNEKHENNFNSQLPLLSNRSWEPEKGGRVRLRMCTCKYYIDTHAHLLSVAPTSFSCRAIHTYFVQTRQVLVSKFELENDDVTHKNHNLACYVTVSTHCTPCTSASASHCLGGAHNGHTLE